jgi:hypothetical protein
LPGGFKLEAMSLMDKLRKGFGFVLMSMGISSPNTLKKKPAPVSPPRPGPRP